GALGLPFGGKIAPRPPAAVDDVGGPRLGFEWGEPRERARGEPLLPLVFAEIKPRRRQGLVVRLGRVVRVSRAAGGVIVGDQRDALVRRILRARVKHERSVADIV